MFIKDKIHKFDILEYIPEKNNIVGSLISTFQNGGKYAHTSIYMADLLYHLFVEYLDHPTDRLKNVLLHADNLLKPNFDRTDVELVLKAEEQKLKNCIFESHIDTGVVIKPLAEKWYPLIDVYRIRPFITQHCEANLDSTEIDMVGAPYDLLSFPGSWLRLQALTWGWRHFSDTRPWLTSEKGYYCSAAVCTVFEKGMGYDLVEGLQAKCTPPSAISNSKRVQFIC